MEKLRFLWALTRGRRWMFLFALALLFTSSYLAMIAPQVTRVFIDSVIGAKPFDAPPFILSWIEGAGGAEFLRANLWIGAAVIVGVGLLYAAFQYFFKVMSGEVSEFIGKNTRDRLYAHLVRLPYDYFARTPSGDILQRCSSDIGAIQGLLSDDLMSILSAVIMIALNAYMMITTDRFLTIVALSLVPVMILLNVAVKGKMSRAFEARGGRDDDLAGFMHQHVQGIRVVKAFGRQAHERLRFGALSRRAGDAVRDSEYAQAYYWSFWLTLFLMQTAMVIVFGIFRVSAGASTVGTMVAFVTYAESLLRQLSYFGYMMISITMAQVALKRLDDILGEPVEDAGGESPDAPAKGAIEFRGVGFAYGEKQILEDITFSIEPGQTVGILGKAGSGKSTLMQLLIRLYDYGSGSITLDGREIRGLSRDYLRRNIGIVTQDPFLFSRTVNENITMAAPGAPAGEVEAAACVACVDRDIREFKEGYETVLGERGTTVSGGQRQRIAIAQAVIRGCPVLALDDSLSAVDAETDRRIRAELQRDAKGRTVFLISHRIDTLRAADLILVMEGGRITQRGDHEALSNQDGLYRRIAEIQQAAGREATA